MQRVVVNIGDALGGHQVVNEPSFQLSRAAHGALPPHAQVPDEVKGLELLVEYLRHHVDVLHEGGLQDNRRVRQVE